MEIKATLNKPYTQKQRLDFIVEHNHKKGSKIKETENSLQAWGLSVQEKAEQEKQIRKAELIAQLDAIDLKTLRSLRSIHAGSGTEEDKNQLEKLEARAEQLREQLHSLNGGEVAV